MLHSTNFCVLLWGISSHGRALASHARGNGIDTRIFQLLKTSHFYFSLAFIASLALPLSLSDTKRRKKQRQKMYILSLFFCFWFHFQINYLYYFPSFSFIYVFEKWISASSLHSFIPSFLSFLSWHKTLHFPSFLLLPLSLFFLFEWLFFLSSFFINCSKIK